MAEPAYKSILWQAQEKVCEALNADPVLSGKVTFLSENSRDIDFEIKQALGKQAIVGVVMTPDATYQGTYQGEELAWDLRDFTVQVVENPTVNRGNPTSADVITAQDAASRVSDVLASPQVELFGIYCPTTIETGEDSGLIVSQAKFNCQVRAQRTPLPGKYRVSWYAEGGTTTSTQGSYEAGSEILFTSESEDKVLDYVSVNGVEVSDKSSYGQTSYTYTTPAEDVFVKVVFAVPVVVPKANLSYSLANVSCDLEPGEYAPGVVAHFKALSVESMSDGTMQAMLSSFSANGVDDLDVARSFGRPSLSCDTWSYELQEGDNNIRATADILPYWKDRTHFCLGYKDSNGALQWRTGLWRDNFSKDTANPQMYISGPCGVDGSSTTSWPIKTNEWNGMDWRDIEEVFIPCYIYNSHQESPAYHPGQYFQKYAFANMPALRKVTVDVMRETDPSWGDFGRTGGGASWYNDCVYFSTNTYSWTIPNIAGLCWNSQDLEEFDYGYARGGFLRFGMASQPNQSGVNLVNSFYNTKLKDLRLRVYIQAAPASSGAIGAQQPNLTSIFNGVKSESPSEMSFEYVNASDGYGADSQAYGLFASGALSPSYGTTPYYRPSASELVYPTLSETQQQTTSAFTTATNRTLAGVAVTRQQYGSLKRIVVPNWAPNTSVGGTNFLNPSDELKEIVLSAGSTLLNTTATNWVDRTFTPSDLSAPAFPTTPSAVSVYLPDAQYDQYLANAQWSLLPARGYELHKMSEWANTPISAL